MGEAETNLSEKLRSLWWELRRWWVQSKCRHDYKFVEKEKGWFKTGSLTFVVTCPKCYKDEKIHMEFPPQVDKEDIID